MAHTESVRVTDWIPSVAGLIFTFAAGAQFLGTEWYFAPFADSLLGQHSLVISLGALLVVFASSQTTDWGRYRAWEQWVVGITVLAMTIHTFSPTLQSFVSSNNPAAGGLALLSGLVTWGVLER